MVRKIISIDQDKCEGCGTCITECSKGAIEIVNGKAALINEDVCDSLGLCIPKCPMYAISFAETDVLEFDKDKAVNEMLRKMLIDTPPALGVMSLNALAATDYLVVVMTPDYFSGRGLSQLQGTVETTRKYLQNPDLKINGLLLTRCDRTNLSSIINDDMFSVAESLDSKIYESKVRQGVAIRESQYLESSLYDMKDTAVLQDYESFITELLKEV